MTATDYTWVGTRPIRHDGYDKVTGKARFAADLNMTGQLWAAFLRSPHARQHRVDRHLEGRVDAGREGRGHR